MTKRSHWMVVSITDEGLAWAFFVAWVCGYHAMWAKPRFLMWCDHGPDGPGA